MELNVDIVKLYRTSCISWSYLLQNITTWYKAYADHDKKHKKVHGKEKTNNKLNNI